MFIRSNVITLNDIFAALKETRDEDHDIWLDYNGIREFKPKRFSQGFQLYLMSMDGKRARNGRDGKAATWTAYGVWMDKLFAIDPDAEISFYKGVEDFREKTAQYVPRGESTPWLDTPAARLEYLRGELRAERISYSELAELQGLAEHIPADDVELREAAGIPEHEDERLNLTKHDFELRDEGSIVLLYPQNDAARSWVDEHLYGEGGAPVQWHGGGVVIDHGLAEAILKGVVEEGYVVASV